VAAGAGVGRAAGRARLAGGQGPSGAAGGSGGSATGPGLGGRRLRAFVGGACLGVGPTLARRLAVPPRGEPARRREPFQPGGRGGRAARGGPGAGAARPPDAAGALRPGRAVVARHGRGGRAGAGRDLGALGRPDAFGGGLPPRRGGPQARRRGGLGCRGGPSGGPLRPPRRRAARETPGLPLGRGGAAGRAQPGPGAPRRPDRLRARARAPGREHEALSGRAAGPPRPTLRPARHRQVLHREGPAQRVRRRGAPARRGRQGGPRFAAAGAGCPAGAGTALRALRRRPLLRGARGRIQGPQGAPGRERRGAARERAGLRDLQPPEPDPGRLLRPGGRRRPPRGGHHAREAVPLGPLRPASHLPRPQPGALPPDSGGPREGEGPRSARREAARRGPPVGPLARRTLRAHRAPVRGRVRSRPGVPPPGL
ncbi:MAG: hypothetical protein AVDCRST_MAG12-2536, partial [uncultured Rubrobacteraceae bacterium]